MDRNYLLTYSYQNDNNEKVFGYSWYEDEEEMMNHIEELKVIHSKFEVKEALEILGTREIIGMGEYDG